MFSGLMRSKLIFLALKHSKIFGRNQTMLVTLRTPAKSEAWWWEYHVVRIAFIQATKCVKPYPERGYVSKALYVFIALYMQHMGNLPYKF